MAVYFDHRWMAPHGIGRFAREVYRRVPGLVPVPMNGWPARPWDMLRWPIRFGTSRDTFFSPGFNVPPRWNAMAGRTVCTVHDLIHIDCPTGRSKIAYYRHVQRPIVRRSPLVFTVSRYSRRRIAQWYGIDPSRIVVVGNGVSEHFSTEGPRHSLSDPAVLYVGNDRPHKDVSTLISAFANLNRGHLHLVMAPTPARQGQIDQLRLNPRVTWHRGLDDTQLAAFYRSAAVTVLPSRYEGFGMPVIESMACGTPVIGADATSIPEIAGGHATLFPAGNVDALTQRLEAAVDGRLMTAGERRDAAAHATTWSWRRVADRITRSLCQIGSLPLPKPRHPSADRHCPATGAAA